MSRLAQLNSCACDSLKLRPMPACIGDINKVAHRVVFESDSDWNPVGETPGPAKHVW